MARMRRKFADKPTAKEKSKPEKKETKQAVDTATRGTAEDRFTRARKTAQEEKSSKPSYNYGSLSLFSFLLLHLQYHLIVPLFFPPFLFLLEFLDVLDDLTDLLGCQRCTHRLGFLNLNSSS